MPKLKKRKKSFFEFLQLYERTISKTCLEITPPQNTNSGSTSIRDTLALDRGISVRRATGCHRRSCIRGVHRELRYSLFCRVFCLFFQMRSSSHRVPSSPRFVERAGETRLSRENVTRGKLQLRHGTGAPGPFSIEYIQSDSVNKKQA